MTFPLVCSQYFVGFVGVVKMPMIKLQSSDGEIFEVEVEIAKASNTIKTMIEGELQQYNLYAYCSVFMCNEVRPLVLRSVASFLTDLGMDDDDDEPVPLPNVNGAIMKKVMGQLTLFKAHL